MALYSSGVHTYVQNYKSYGVLLSQACMSVSVCLSSADTTIVSDNNKLKYSSQCYTLHNTIKVVPVYNDDKTVRDPACVYSS